MNLNDLLRLAEAGPDKLKRLGELALELKALDEQRAAILAELADLGVAGDPPPQPSPVSRRSEPMCHCGAEATEEVDGTWYCEAHGNEAVTARLG